MHILNLIVLTYIFLRKKGTHLVALPLFTPFVGPDGSSYHYGGRFLHLGAVTTQEWSSQVFHCHISFCFDNA